MDICSVKNVWLNTPRRLCSGQDRYGGGLGRVAVPCYVVKVLTLCAFLCVCGAFVCVCVLVHAACGVSVCVSACGCECVHMSMCVPEHNP